MTPRSWALAFAGPRILLRVDGDAGRVPTLGEIEEMVSRGLLEVDPVPVRLTSAPDTRVLDLPEAVEPPEGYRLEGLRSAYHHLPEPEFRAAATARQKIDWHRSHRFCSRCGTRTERHTTHEAMVCADCGQLHFARIAPAVIVLVRRGDEALLARSPHFTPGVYSTLAGFVEPGETLEECIHREIEEEVGVTVRDPRYFGSQPHPFPHSLMVGFVAEWASGEIRIDDDEIEDARWFHRDELPDLPHPMSIARRLIEDFTTPSGA